MYNGYRNVQEFFWKNFGERFLKNLTLGKQGVYMQVVSGFLRGVRLGNVQGYNMRPTLDHVKQAFFNIIQNDIEGTNFLDCFSGTGQIGIEALSRGACSCVFIDKNPQLTKKNLEKIELEIEKKLQFTIIGQNIENALQTLDKPFGFIYADPPYSFKDIHELFNGINKHKLLAPNGFVVLEQRIKKLQTDYLGFSVAKIKNYGNVQLVFYAEEK